MPAITTLRFFAAMAVIFHHFGPTLFAQGLSLRVANAGYVGVGFFFFLSGFVLSLRAERGAPVRHAPRAFLLARIARIYPLYVAALIFSAPLFFAKTGERPLVWFVAIISARVFLLQAWIGHFGAWNVPDWSLSVEWAFYLAFPWLAPRIVRNRSAVIALLTFGIGTAWIGHVANPIWVSSPSPQKVSEATGFIAYHPIFRFHEFAAGIFVGANWKRVGWMLWLSRKKGTFPFAALALLSLLSCADRLPFLPVGNGMLLPFWTALVLGVSDGSMRVTRALSIRIGVVLGESSFAIYLLHAPLWAWFEHFGRRPDGFGSFATYLATLVALSLAAFRGIEVPARKKLRSFLT